MALTKARYRMIEGGFADPLDYGAVGDGSTDDTVAVQAALDSGVAVLFSSADGYAINTKLTDAGTTQRVFRNGSRLIYKGDSTTRMLDITSTAEYIDPIFDGDSRQPSLALVSFVAGSGPKFRGGKTHNIAGSDFGTNLKNAMYGLHIDTDNVREFEVIDHLFEDIQKDNTTAGVTTPTEGIGFCGGIIAIPSTGTTATGAYTAISKGKILGCTFKNIQTLRDTGLSEADFVRFDDGDGIRLLGDETYHPDCDILVDGCRFEDCSKRGYKSAIRGARFRNSEIVSRGGVPYPMSSAFKIQNDNVVENISVEVGSSARQVLNAFQLGMQGNGNTRTDVINCHMDFAKVVMEVIGGSASATLDNILFKDVTCHNVSVRAYSDSPNGAAPTGVEDGITLENIVVKGSGNTAQFATVTNAPHVKSVWCDNMDFKLPANSRVDFADIRLSNTSFTGTASRGFVELGSGDCQLGEINVDLRGFGNTAWPGGVNYLVLIYGDDWTLGKYSFRSDDTLLTTHAHSLIYGDGFTVGQIDVDSPGTVSIATTASTDFYIGEVVRRKGTATSKAAVLCGVTGSDNMGFGQVTDLRFPSVAPFRLLTGSTECHVGRVLTNTTAGSVSQDDTGGQLTVDHSINWT